MNSDGKDNLCGEQKLQANNMQETQMLFVSIQNQIHGHGMVHIKLMIQNSSKKNLDLMKKDGYSEIVIWATILKNQFEILRSMEDGALEPDEARELLTIMIKILDLIKPNLRKRWAKILLIGVSGTLEELQEHIEEIK